VSYIAWFLAAATAALIPFAVIRLAPALWGEVVTVRGTDVVWVTFGHVAVVLMWWTIYQRGVK